MLEKILSYRNLEQAQNRVIKNKGVGGVDGMQTDELRDFLHTQYTDFCNSVLTGTYQPQAVKKVEIPKANGGKRMLGIPTVKDRLLQQAISQRLQQIYEPKFSETSYGFRSGRNAHQAVTRAKRYLTEGYEYVIELDLEKFFDKVNHDYLMTILSQDILDKRVLKLIRQYLQSGIMEGGIVSTRTEGTPQGSPLSPLLSNIILDKLDKELENRGHRFVRYADDCSIYVKSEKSAQRVLESITKYIETRLHLKVNREKSKISKPKESKLLGFTFSKTKGEWLIRISPTSIQRMKDKLRQQTRRNSGKNYSEMIETLQVIINGWVNYFRIANAKKVMKILDELTRTRLRMKIWKEWKNGKSRIANLIKLGINKFKAYEWGNTSKSYCRVAHSPILCRSLNNNFFQKNGYRGFGETYEEKTKLQIPFF